MDWVSVTGPVGLTCGNSHGSRVLLAGRDSAEDVALHLGTAHANIASVFDPQAVILLGESFVPLVDHIRRITSQIVPWPVDVCSLHNWVRMRLSRCH